MTVRFTFFFLLFVLCFSHLSWNQTAFSIREAVVMGDNCTSLQINGQNEMVLPKELNACQQLTEIQFTNNTFLLIDSTLFLPSVTSLNLEGTSINTWEIDQIAKAFPNLKTLNLSKTGLYHIGSSLVGFSKLEELNLSYNHLSYLPEDFQYLQRLKRLNLAYNDFSNNVSALGYLWNLKVLQIEGNNQLLPEALLRSISLNPQLKTLKLDFSETINKELFILRESSLQEIIFNGPVVTIPKNLSVLPQLKSIGFSNNQTVNDPNNILTRLKSLQSYQFEQSNVSGTLLQQPKIKYAAIVSDASNIDQHIAAVAQAPNLDSVFWQLPSNLSDTLTQLKAQMPQTVIVANNGIIQAAIHDSTDVALEKHLPETTITVIDPSKEKKLTIDGATLSIPKNAFLTQQGAVVNSPVKLEVNVFDNALETALSGVPMSYYSDSTSEILSSNGMINFTATDLNGNPLQPNPNALVEVELTDLQPATTPNLFFLNAASNEWKTTEQVENIGFTKNQLLQLRIDSINKVDFKSQINIVPYAPIYSFKMKYKNAQSYMRLNKFDKIVYKSNPFRDKTFQYIQLKNNLLKGQNLYLDTLISKEDVAKIMLRNRNYLPNKRKIRGQLEVRHEPRKVWNVQISPELENDRFRITFFLEDTLFHFPFTTTPVYSKGYYSVVANQKSNTQFEFERRLAHQADSLIQQTIRLKEDHIKDSIANMLKQFALNNIQPNLIPINTSIRRGNGRLIIQLFSFGLVNADSYIPPITWTYTSLSQVLTDQNGKTYNRPASTRVVWLDRYTYIDQSSDQIGIIKNDQQIGLVQLEPELIGIVYFEKKQDEPYSTIHTINTKGLTQDQIIQLINAR